jgi:hypothetical protein
MTCPAIPLLVAPAAFTPFHILWIYFRLQPRENS